MRPQATFSFFIFSQLFYFFSLLVAPSSSSFLPHRPSFLLVSPSSSSLFFARPAGPAMFKSFRIRKSPFFINFDESMMDGRTDGPTNGLTDQRIDGQGLLWRISHEQIPRGPNHSIRPHFVHILPPTPTWQGKAKSHLTETQFYMLWVWKSPKSRCCSEKKGNKIFEAPFSKLYRHSILKKKSCNWS